MSVQWSLDDKAEKNKLNSTSVRKGTTSEITALGSDKITPGDVMIDTSKNVLLLNVGTSGDPYWVSDLLPLGTIRVWPGNESDIPSGWVICDGDSYSKSTYSDGYASIGDSFGSSTSNFNVPDLETDERFVMGANTHSEIGETDGEIEHTLTIAEMPEHTHTTSDVGRQGLTFSQDHRILSKTTSSVGGGDPHNNLPPYIKLHYIIKLEIN